MKLQNLGKNSIDEKALKTLNEKKPFHSKVKRLKHEKISMKKYLKKSQINQRSSSINI